MAKKKAAIRKATGEAVPERRNGGSPLKKKSFSKGGRPPFVPTDKHRAQVETLAGLGLRQEEVCLLVKNPQTGQPITEKTLRRHFANELAWGSVKAHANIAKSLFNKAIGNGPQAVTAAIWWTKCRMGWKERQVVEVESKAGVLVSPAAMTPEEWIRSAAARAVRKKEPGT